MNIYHSRDGRKVIDTLKVYGVVPLDGKQHFDIEIICSIFYPNHIVGVIKHVLSGKGLLGKLGRAQEQGFGYFRRPAFDMLKSRPSSWRRDVDAMETLSDPKSLSDWHVGVYTIVSTTLMSSDVGSDEMAVLLYEIPLLTNEQLELVMAIRACKDQGKRSIHYLKGVLSRSKADKEARTRDIMRSRSENVPWSPPGDHIPLDPAEIKEFEEHWGLIESDIELERKLGSQDT